MLEGIWDKTAEAIQKLTMQNELKRYKEQLIE